MEPPKIHLRPFREEDSEAMFNVLGDEQVMKFSLKGVKTRQETKEFVRWAADHYAEHGWGLLAVVDEEQDKVVGYCGLLVQCLKQLNIMEISYRLSVDSWGRGIATEAAKRVRDDALHRLKLIQLVSLIEPLNLASIRVAERIGMGFDWEYEISPGRPVYVYSLLHGKKKKTKANSADK